MPWHLHSFQAEEEDDEVPLGQRAAQLADGSTDRTAMRARARATLSAGRQPRENKHRPSEASSKRPVPVLRESIQGPRTQGKDPRFESLAGGAFDERRFKSQYAFLYDEKLPEERKGLRAALKKAKGAEARADLQARLTRVEQALREENARRWKLDFKAKLKVCDGGLVKGAGAVLLYRGGVGGESQRAGLWPWDTAALIGGEGREAVR